MKRKLWLMVVLAIVFALLSVPTAVMASGPNDSSDYAFTVELIQVNPGSPTAPYLSFVDANGDGVPDDLNGNTILGEAGLAPNGDQLMRIDRPGQVFEGTIDEVSELSKRGKKAVQKLTGADLSIEFNSTIFIGPEVAPGLNVIFGAAGGSALVTQKEGKESLLFGYSAALEGTLNLTTSYVAVSDAGTFWVEDAEGGLNSVKKTNGAFNAVATGFVGFEEATVTLTGAVK